MSPSQKPEVILPVNLRLNVLDSINFVMRNEGLFYILTSQRMFMCQDGLTREVVFFRCRDLDGNIFTKAFKAIDGEEICL